MALCKKGFVLVAVALVVAHCSDLSFVSGFSASAAHEPHTQHHGCSHAHHHDHGHGHSSGHSHSHGHGHQEERLLATSKLPEELAEEEDMKLYGFEFHQHVHGHDHEHFGAPQLSVLGISSKLCLWIHSLGCSLLVSMASLICLIILPVIFVQGKPSKAVVDSLALFGAGAMLGDAFLHQLPHAFGGGHSDSHDHHEGHSHSHLHEHSHSHSLDDLSVGLSILAGIVLFLLVEKTVRYVEENSGGTNAWSHGHHHHHHHKKSKKLKDDNDSHDDLQSESSNGKDGRKLTKSSDGEVTADGLNDSLIENTQQDSHIRKRNTRTGGSDDKQHVHAANDSTPEAKSAKGETTRSPSNLVFGYLNLFSDGVHNFTDGMALGSAFLLHGSVGGWSRTLFLLAHEIPQEVGDFGILVRSGFSVSKALFFNFLSALVALLGTAVALILGQNAGQSSLIEGFTAGGFIYIAVAGVLAEMNNNGGSSLKSTALQLTALILGIGVALCISLFE
ncbi:IAA-alanine resistance protein 1-like isoform X1 [Malus domestica]|uniref:IAA-alanine resistance protein 1-like isoform X1 n=1 Tax=Malus domestica TaxID=3750 RepID=UPI0010AA2AAD|nr:IAA-alanine resistance protein 1-like isoform X1 [Malus domestica]